MVNKIRIVTHILPWEIDEFNESLIQFKRNSYYLEQEDTVTFSVTFNLSDKIIDWENSKLPKEYFLDKFNLIIEKLDWVNDKIINIVHGDECLSTSDNIRNNIIDCKEENILWIDSDIYFPDHTLKTMFNSISVVKEHRKYYIISPESQRKWDATWDCLANERYLNDEYGYGLDLDVFELNRINSTIVDDISLKGGMDRIKFGGGVFNIFSSNLMKYIDVPNIYRKYGGIDTYIMQSADAMKYYKHDVDQYVVQNLIVGEIHKYRLSDCGRSNVTFYKKYLKLYSEKNKEREENAISRELNDALADNILRIKDDIEE